MYFMNEMDVQYHATHPLYSGIRRQAAVVLERHMEQVNKVSDGWAYWAPPVRAAKTMMEIVEGKLPDTQENYNKAIGALKRFYTTIGHKAGMVFEQY